MNYKIYTLGCKVNEYESQVMADLLDKAGYIKSDNPDVCIINTCTVTNKADSKSRKVIRSLKKQFPNALIVAVGCMIQNKKDDIESLDIDIALGTKDKSKIVDIINKKKYTKIYDIDQMDFENMQLEDFDLTRAYIKIQDGCDNYCSYCIIPYVRGHVRSKNHLTVLDEAKKLINHGHKEIVLTGIHTGSYHDGNIIFADLLKQLVQLKGLHTLRISSIEITELNNKFLDILKNSNVLANHMHIPLQSGSDTVLKLMNRKYDIKYFKEKIKKIKQIRPDINITTDVIVGHPGETEELFKETIKNIYDIGFTKIHVFPYSKREGTKSSTMKNQVDEKIKKQRVSKLLEVSKELEEKYMSKHLNKEVIFIAETYSNGYLYGHTSNYLKIKAKGNKDMLKKEVKVITKQIEYPCILSIIK